MTLPKAGADEVVVFFAKACHLRCLNLAMLEFGRTALRGLQVHLSFLK